MCVCRALRCCLAACWARAPGADCRVAACLSRSDRPARPFRCLDAQYRRELVRVYLTNVESICRCGGSVAGWQQPSTPCLPRSCLA
jgi:hypothetical protein